MSHSTGKHTRGFTILETMFAAIVLALGITTSITTLQRGMRAVDTARVMTAADQLLQDEIEGLRLLNWAELDALPKNAVVTRRPETFGSDSWSQDAAGAAADRLEITRSIADKPGQPGIKQVKLTAKWRGLDGSPHERTFQTFYAEHGINEFLLASR